MPKCKSSGLVTLIGVLLVGTTFPVTASPELVKEAKEFIANDLKDPDSARFRKLRTDGVRRIVCGEYNAKNSYAGYIGYQQFFYSAAEGKKPSLLTSGMVEQEELKEVAKFKLLVLTRGCDSATDVIPE